MLISNFASSDSYTFVLIDRVTPSESLILNKNNFLNPCLMEKAVPNFSATLTLFSKVILKFKEFVRHPYVVKNFFSFLFGFFRFPYEFILSVVEGIFFVPFIFFLPSSISGLLYQLIPCNLKRRMECRS